MQGQSYYIYTNDENEIDEMPFSIDVPNKTDAKRITAVGILLENAIILVLNTPMSSDNLFLP